MALLSSVRIIDATILQQNNAFFFFGDAFSDKNTNTFILEATADYLVVTGEFYEVLFTNP